MRILTYEYTSNSFSQQLTIKVHLRKNTITHLTSNYNSSTSKFTCELWQDEFFNSLISSLNVPPDLSPADRLAHAIDNLSDENRAILTKEYQSEDLITSFYRGLGSYLTWLLLIEEHSYLFPDVINIPVPLDSGKVCNRNLFAYLNIYATALSTIQKDICEKLVREVLRFFKCWDDFFITGPNIDTHEYTRACMQIVACCTEHTIKLQQEQLQIMRTYTKQLEDNLGFFMLENSTTDLQKLIITQQHQINDLERRFSILEYNTDSAVNLVDDVLPKVSKPLISSHNKYTPSTPTNAETNEPSNAEDNAEDNADSNTEDKAEDNAEDNEQMRDKSMETIGELVRSVESRYEPIINEERETSLASDIILVEAPPTPIVRKHKIDKNKDKKTDKKTDKNTDKTDKKTDKKYKQFNRKNGFRTKLGKTRQQIISHRTETIRLSEEEVIPQDKGWQSKGWQSNFSNPSTDGSKFKNIEIPEKKEDKVTHSRTNRFTINVTRPVERVPFQRRCFTSIRP